jgi:hypothetical protein
MAVVCGFRGVIPPIGTATDAGEVFPKIDIQNIDVWIPLIFCRVKLFSVNRLRSKPVTRSDFLPLASTRALVSGVLGARSSSALESPHESLEATDQVMASSSRTAKRSKITYLHGNVSVLPRYITLPVEYH